MLAIEAPIKDLLPNQEEAISLAAGLKCHYKIDSSHQPIPLKCKIRTIKGINSIYISVSRVIERPHREHYEKIFTITSENSYFIFPTESSNLKYFTERFIYLTIECTKESSLSLIINFGRKKYYQYNLSERNSICGKPQIKKITNDIAIRSLMHMVISSRAISSTRIRFKKVTKHLPTIKSHREHVLEVKQQKDDADRLRKFLLSNQAEINRRYTNLILEHNSKIKIFQRSVLLWISHVVLCKAAVGVYNAVVWLRKRNERNETKLHNSIMIYIFLRAKLSKIAEEPRQRLNYRLIWYSSSYNVVE